MGRPGVVPRRRLGEALRRIGEMGRESGIRVANVFHAGDGNLHPLIMFDAKTEKLLKQAETSDNPDLQEKADAARTNVQTYE